MTTVSQAAKILNVSSRRVLQFIQERRLSAQRINARLYLLDAEEVERFANEPREPGNPGLKKSPKSH